MFATVVNTFACVFAEMLGGRWVPGPCGGCGRKSRVKFEAFPLDFYSRWVINPWRCKRCARRPR